VDAVIELLKKDGAVLDIMADAEFVEDAKRDYDDIIARLQDIISQIYDDRAKELMAVGFKQLKYNNNYKRDDKYTSLKDGRLPTKSYAQQRKE
jgi:hypothetical protein